MTGRPGTALTVNGEDVQCARPEGQFLTEFLRFELGLTGTKLGCAVGVCGICTVLLDGQPMSSCLVPMITMECRHVWTIEGLAALAGSDRSTGEEACRGLIASQRISAVFDAFISCDAIQCGICTPGQVISAIAFAGELTDADDASIRYRMGGSLCRCTGYGSILRAIRQISENGSG